MNEREKTRAGQSFPMHRRAAFGSAGAGLGWLLGGCSSTHGEKQRPQPDETMNDGLKRGDRVEIDGKAETLLEKAYRLGYDYEKKHGGCARCTVAALQDALPFVPIDLALFRGSTCLDGGATPVAVQNCGAFTGAGMVIGHLCGSARGETFEGDAKLAHELLHKVYGRFKEHYGTVLCRDVRKGAQGDCPEVVGRAARWVAEVLLEEFAGYNPPKPPEPEEKAEQDEAGPAETASMPG